jgi:hypothetical protein
MGDDVFHRRWLLAEDELLRMLWRCRTGENPDVVLLELYVQRGDTSGPPRSVSTRRARRGPRRAHGVRQ